MDITEEVLNSELEGLAQQMQQAELRRQQAESQMKQAESDKIAINGAAQLVNALLGYLHRQDPNSVQPATEAELNGQGVDSHKRIILPGS